MHKWTDENIAVVVLQINSTTATGKSNRPALKSKQNIPVSITPELVFEVGGMAFFISKRSFAFNPVDYKAIYC